MVLSVDTIGFTFINDSPFIEKIVPILEGYDFLLLIVVTSLSFSHANCLTILCVNIRDCISDHVVRKVDHESKLLVLLRWLHLLLMTNHIS